MTDSTKNNGGNTNNTSNNMSNTISSKPTLITTPHLRFLIMDAPRQSNLHLYIKECRRHHVTDVVRVCEPTYLGAELNSAGITLHEMAYEDGHSPSEEILKMWLDLVEERFFGSSATAATTGSAAGTKNENTIAVHCVAGLGRAPVLVAIALMEFEKMDAVDAVMMIRKGRRGAINEKQLQYLEGYKCRRRGGGSGCACVIL
jgi:protein tyrosine phosphatase type 4A